jgi:hypothetical protein
MKRILAVLFLFIALPHSSLAQSSTPEFKLVLHYSDAGGGGNSDPKALGYDPSATVGIDPQFGESLYPGFPAPGDYFLAFFLNDSSSGDATETDILPKPATDSFTLQYTLYLSPYKSPAKLSWDRSQIPAAVKGLWITPLHSPFQKIDDMTTQDSAIITATDFTDPNYAGNWEPAVITLYYNTVPHFLDVPASGTAVAGLLSNLRAYPNPMLTSGALMFTLSEPASVIVSGYDAVGREVLHIEKQAPAGMNRMDLSALANTHGAVLLRVDAANGTEHATNTVMLVKE